MHPGLWLLLGGLAALVVSIFLPRPAHRIVFALSVVAMVGGLGLAMVRVTADDNACEAQGGRMIRSSSGVVCVDRSAVINP